MLQFSSVQSLSHVRLFATPWITAPQASLSITIFQSTLRLTKECLQSLNYVHYNEHCGGPKEQWDIIKEMIYFLKQGLRVSVLMSNSLWPHKWSEVTQLYCLTLCNPMDCRPPGSSIHGIFQARILEWVSISFSRGSSWPRDRTWVSCIAGRLFTIGVNRELTVAYLAPLSSTISQTLLKFTSPELPILSNHLILWRPCLLLPSIFPNIKIFSNELALLIRWPKYWSFSPSWSWSFRTLASVLPMNIQVYFIYDWLVWSRYSPRDSQESSLAPQLENINSSVLSLFIDQVSHPYMTTGKTIPLTTWTFVNKVLSLLFNTVFRFVIAFLPRSKCLLILWLQKLSAVILEPKE